MPYRRLPNTDKARIHALSSAIEMCEKFTLNELAITQNTVYKLRTFYPKFIQAIETQKSAYSNQVQKSKSYKQAYLKLKLYLSHFIQVLNFAIIRKERKADIKKYYGLSINDFTVPKLQTERELILWGKKIIAGENERLINGGTPISNPKIALVSIYYDKYLQAYRYQKNLQDIHNRAINKIVKLRPVADKLIQTIWNEIENSYNTFPSIIKREKAKKYGIKYVYRKNEKRIVLSNVVSLD